MGFIYTILGLYTTGSLWGGHTGLAILTIIATLYQASSLNEMRKTQLGIQSEDRWQITINILSSFLIIGLFIYSFFD